MKRKNSKRIITAIMLLAVIFLLCGCRERIISGEAGSTAGAVTAVGQGSMDDAPQDTPLQEDPAPGTSGELDPSSDDITLEDPHAPRKEYDETADSDIITGTDKIIGTSGEGDGYAAAEEEAEAVSSLLNDLSPLTATQTVSVEESDRMGTSEEADVAESSLTYYKVLLRERQDSQFECQKLNAYWETKDPLTTVYKRSPEHALLQKAGLYSVSSRLLEENLRVEPDWVCRKDPGIIIKVVGKDVLGARVLSFSHMPAVLADLKGRPGWDAIDAVKNNRVLFLSEELLEGDHMQTIAALLIAKTAYPSIYADVDIDQAIGAIIEEATSTPPAGSFYYSTQQ